jgi:DNA-binding transcriptional LysR family regulator
LFLSQSAVSHAIKALENDIGCRLLDRLGKRVHLTPAGEHLMHYAERILRDMSTARESIEHLGKWGKGRVRIGASGTICQYVLPAVLRGFRKEFPDWLVSVEPAETRHCIDLLRERRLDLALALAPNQAEAIELIPCFSDELMFLVSPEHPWARAGKVERQEIATQHFVLYSKTSHTFELIGKYFQRDGIVPKLCMELGNIEAIKELVKLGLGVTILAPWVARKELAENSLVALPLGKRKLKRQWALLRSVDRKPALAEELLVRLCLAATETFHLSAREAFETRRNGSHPQQMMDKAVASGR